MTREEKENLLREAVDILIRLDNHLMTSRENAEFSAWVEDLMDTSIPQFDAVPMSVIEDIKAEIKEWYWQADKQAIAKDPCVVDAMVDLFIRTINKHISGGAE